MRSALLAFVCLVSSVVGQSISDAEVVLQSAYKKWNGERAVLDSLQARMEALSRSIEKEKSASAPDEKKISSLMSDGIALSTQIRTQQRVTSETGRHIDALKRYLLGLIAQKMDSLRAAESSVPRRDRDILRSRLQMYAEQRAWLEPAIPMLSFDPQRVLLLETDDQRTRDLLEKAIDEIDRHLARVRESRTEFESIVALQQRTQEFADESRGGSTAFLLQGGSSATRGSEGVLFDPQDALNSKAESVTGLLQQLHSGSFLVQSEDRDYSVEEYVRLLKKAEKELQVFGNSLRAKVGR